MKLLTPHYILLALAAAAAALTGIAQVPAFVADATILNTIAGLLVGVSSMLGVTSHSAVTPAPVKP